MDNLLRNNLNFQKNLQLEEELSDYIAIGKKRDIHIHHQGTRYIYNKITKRFESIFPSKVKKLLDIGCGFGDFLLLTKLGEELYGIDISQERVNITRERLKGKNARIEKGIAEQLPYQDHLFDLIVMQSVLHHCMYPNVVLQEARRVLSKRGYLVLVEGANDKWYRKTVHYFFERFSRKYEASQFDHHSKRELEEILTRNDFKITIERDESIPFAWIGRIGRGNERIWEYLQIVDRYLPNIFPWYHLFVCEKNEKD